MRILFLTHAFNSLSQRLFVELELQEHEVSVEFDINDVVALQAVDLFQPELIIAPFLKRAIAEDIWRQHTCLIVHPGIRGDRGPSALDWAILNREEHWGVTILQANSEMDAGDIWASSAFRMRRASKASLYHIEVTEAVVEAVLIAVSRFQSKTFKPQLVDYSNPDIHGKQQPLMTQSSRAIDWQLDSTEMILRKIRSADGFPGVAEKLFERQLFFYDAHPENSLRGKAGDIIARCGGSICCATIDGAIWIGHMRDKSSKHPFKLPTNRVLGTEIAELPDIIADKNTGYRDIWYEEEAEVGYLHFPFYNGAMSTNQCERLLQAYQQARQQNTKVIVLMGGPDYWSNGMHLNLIEASDSPADESWRNINAIDDLALEIINTDSHMTIAALQGNAGAGGVFLARASDAVWARKGVILNPHYKDMGNLYGSEYWTYLLPRYTTDENALRITQARLPMGVHEALTLGLLDAVFDNDPGLFVQSVKQGAMNMATESCFADHLKQKNNQRLADEKQRPLAEYRQQELARMKQNFYGFDPSYHVARYNFVYKVPKSRTPMTIARHRRKKEYLQKAS